MSSTKKHAPGEGSVYRDKNTGRWRSEIQYTDSSGKRVRKRFSGKSFREAREKLNALRRELLLGRELPGAHLSDITFGELCRDWLNGVKKYELKPRSYLRLCQTVNNQLIPRLGSMPVGMIGREDIQKTVNALYDSGLSRSTLTKAFQAVRAALDWHRQSSGGADICAGVRLPKKSAFMTSAPKYFTADECRTLLEAAYSERANGKPVYRLGGAIGLLMFTGMRAGELIALRWEDIDKDDRLLRIRKSAGAVPDRDFGGCKLVVTCPKTAGSERAIPLCGSALEALGRLRKQTFESGYVIAGKNGGMLDPRCLDDLFYSVQKRAGIPPEKRSGVHSLRHTFASLLYCAGADTSTVSRLLGHSSVAVTGNIYLHISGEKFAKEVSKLDLFRTM